MVMHPESVGSMTPPGRTGVARFPYRCIASSQGWASCPAIDTTVSLGQAVVHIPNGGPHSTFFSASLRLQGDGKDGGGIFEMWLVLDGVRVGTVGLQQLTTPSAVSTRTVTASYLATGSERLAPGPHKVELKVKATGDFLHLAITQNLPLLWFSEAEQRKH